MSAKSEDGRQARREPLSRVCREQRAAIERPPHAAMRHLNQKILQARPCKTVGVAQWLLAICDRTIELLLLEEVNVNSWIKRLKEMDRG